MIRLEQVYKRFADHIVLDGVDLAVGSGEVILVSGATGAGKSTLLGLLYAAHLADSGAVTVFGHDVARLRLSSIPLLRRCVVAVPQSLALLDERSALANVALAREVRAEPRAQARDRALIALDTLGLADCARVRVADLSIGQRQCVALARAVAAAPAVLVADEPSAHLDNDGRSRLVEVLRALQARGSAAVVATGDHKLLAAGARHSWRHVELADGHLSVVADRAPQPVVAPAAVDQPNVVHFPLSAHAGVS